MRILLRTLLVFITATPVCIRLAPLDVAMRLLADTARIVFVPLLSVLIGFMR